MNVACFEILQQKREKKRHKTKKNKTTRVTWFNTLFENEWKKGAFLQKTYFFLFH